MKRVTMLLLSAILIIGKSLYIPSHVVFADQSEEVFKEGESEEILEEKSEYYEESKENIEDSNGNLTEIVLEQKETAEQEAEKIDENIKILETSKILEEKEAENSLQNEQQNLVEMKHRACLQMPQKLGITLDPFEINGKGQVYSEQYVIKNIGDTAGVLRLSNLVCRAGDDSGVIIKTNKSEIHNADEKFVYIEIIFGNGDVITLSPEERIYEIRLEVGEELTFYYTGEMNENAAQSWEEHDVLIGMDIFIDDKAECLDEEIVDYGTDREEKTEVEEEKECLYIS